MNILILTDYYPPDKHGGVGQIAKNLKEVFERNGHPTFVLTTGSRKDDEEKHGIFRTAENLIYGIWINNFKVFRFVNRYNIDVIHLHQSATTLFLLLKIFKPLLKNFPFVVSSLQVSYCSEFAEVKCVAIEGKTFWPRAKEYLEKYIFDPAHIILDFIGYVFADIVTVVSTETKKEFQRTYGKVRKRQIKVVPNGADLGEFSHKSISCEPSFEKKIADKTVLTYVGVFRVRKRVFNLLYALKMVLEYNKDVVLMLIGGGRGYEKQVRLLIESLGLQDHIVHVGQVPHQQIPSYLRATDIFCLLSSYEGMPLAVLEAMAMGIPVVTSNVSGMKDLLDDGQTGMLTAVDDIEGIAAALIRLVSNAEEQRRIGENAKAKILKDYSWQSIGEAYLELFSSK